MVHVDHRALDAGIGETIECMSISVLPPSSTKGFGT